MRFPRSKFWIGDTRSCAGIRDRSFEARGRFMTSRNCKSPLPTVAGKSARLSFLAAALVTGLLLSSCGVPKKAKTVESSEYSATLLSARTVDGSMMVVNATFQHPFDKAVEAEFEHKKF